MLEDWRDWNLRCGGEMREYRKEDQWRRRVSGQFTTLRHEGQEQTGLDTPVVTTVNGARLVWETRPLLRGANALNVPPGGDAVN